MDDHSSTTVESEPIRRFREWLAQAEAKEPSNPSACALATVDADGQPSVRMVLLRAVDERGFVFYTNLNSRKGRDLEAQPRAALCFHWKSLDKQVRVEGPVHLVDDGEADAYFATRSRMSQIGAWASDQSQPMAGRFDLEKRVAEYTARFAVGSVPRPPRWSGYRIAPTCIEFWSEGRFRLHDRVLYRHDEDGWRSERLYP